VSLRVDIPIFDRGQGDAARARADKASADAARAALLTRAAAEVDVAKTNAEALHARASAFKTDVVPRAESLFASTSKAVEIGGGTSDVLALVDAARTLRETRTALIDLEADASKADAELLFTIGAWDAQQESR
jgi:cobalt-zinc-cadmium efflux system outer membrane protein